MKTLARILTCLIVISCTHNQSKNDLNRYHLKGKIKSITETKFTTIEKLDEAQTENFKGKDIYHFNEEGNLLVLNQFNPNDCLLFKYSYQHGNKGDVIEVNQYKPNDSLIYKYTHKFDEKGNNIEKYWYNADGHFLYKYTCKYDDKGNNIESVFRPEGNTEKNCIYKFNYDKSGNWIKRIEFENDKAVELRERVITYY